MLRAQSLFFHMLNTFIIIKKLYLKALGIAHISEKGISVKFFFQLLNQWAESDTLFRLFKSAALVATLSFFSPKATLMEQVLSHPHLNMVMAHKLPKQTYSTRA